MDPSEKLARLRVLENEKLPAEQAKPIKPRGALYGFLAFLIVILIKFKGLLFLLLSKLKFLVVALKFLKVGKIFLTFGSMFASIMVYSRLYGWKFAAGFVFLILIHELGHGAAARLLGLNVGAPIFIPFFGAFIALKDQPKTRFDEAIIGAGGPFFGAIGSALLALFASMNILPDYRALFFAVAHFSFVLNLFNLLPIFGLDGDRITRPLTRKTFFLLAICLGGIIFWANEMGWQMQPHLIIIALLFLLKSAFSRGPKTKLEKLNARSTTLSQEVAPREKWISFFGFLFLVVILLTGAGITERELIHRY